MRRAAVRSSIPTDGESLGSRFGAMRTVGMGMGGIARLRDSQFCASAALHHSAAIHCVPHRLRRISEKRFAP